MFVQTEIFARMELVCVLRLELRSLMKSISQTRQSSFPWQARCHYLARLGLAAVSRKKKFQANHKINSLLTKLVLSRCRAANAGVSVCFVFVYVFFIFPCEFIGQYPAILTSRKVGFDKERSPWGRNLTVAVPSSPVNDGFCLGGFTVCFVCSDTKPTQT